jgi:hypothetical protein
MKFNYVLYIKGYHSNGLELLLGLERELYSLGIYNQSNIPDEKSIVTSYQDNAYEVYLEEYPNFPIVLSIKTDYEFHLDKREGFITLIWRLMNRKFGIGYGHMEILSRDSFDRINEMFEHRFIDQIKLHSILERTLEPIEFEKQGSNDQIQITRGRISKEECKEDEEAWVRFANKLEYDGWDTVNSAFLPLSFQEYEEETLAFIKFWKMPEDAMDLGDKQQIVSIIRVEKVWDFNEYLIKKKDAVEYLSVDVITG